jgi:uncharacterized membrane protein
MSVYQLVLFIHILAAIAWVGGAFFLQLVATRINRTGDPVELANFSGQIAWFGLRYFLPASLIVFLAGLYMTISNWGFSQPWISLSMLLWLTSVAIGAAYIGPRTQKVSELYAAEGPTSVEARAITQRLFLIGRIDIVLFLVIVALMVFKPGSGSA